MPKLTKPKIILVIQGVHKVKEMFQMQIQNLATLIQMYRHGNKGFEKPNWQDKKKSKNKPRPKFKKPKKASCMKIQKARL